MCVKMSRHIDTHCMQCMHDLYLKRRRSRVQAQVGAAVQWRSDVGLQQLLRDGAAEKDGT